MDPEDEHFIVWMRTAGLKTFRKLWGKIEGRRLKKGTYYIKIVNNYNVEPFGGTKSIILSVPSSMGGKNNFLMIFIYLSAFLTFTIAIIFYLQLR
jgi:hypothetical protein